MKCPECGSEKLEGLQGADFSIVQKSGKWVLGESNELRDEMAFLKCLDCGLEWEDYVEIDCGELYGKESGEEE